MATTTGSIRGERECDSCSAIRVILTAVHDDGGGAIRPLSVGSPVAEFDHLSRRGRGRTTALERTYSSGGQTLEHGGHRLDRAVRRESREAETAINKIARPSSALSNAYPKELSQITRDRTE